MRLIPKYIVVNRMSSIQPVVYCTDCGCCQNKENIYDGSLVYEVKNAFHVECLDKSFFRYNTKEYFITSTVEIGPYTSYPRLNDHQRK